jgi:hypothetical protein
MDIVYFQGIMNGLWLTENNNKWTLFNYGNCNGLFLGIVGNYEKTLVGYKQQ